MLYVKGVSLAHSIQLTRSLILHCFLLKFCLAIPYAIILPLVPFKMSRRNLSFSLPLPSYISDSYTLFVDHSLFVRSTCPNHFEIVRTTLSLSFSMTPTLRLVSLFPTPFILTICTYSVDTSNPWHLVSVYPSPSYTKFQLHKSVLVKQLFRTTSSSLLN